MSKKTDPTFDGVKKIGDVDKAVTGIERFAAWVLSLGGLAALINQIWAKIDTWMPWAAVSVGLTAFYIYERFGIAKERREALDQEKAAEEQRRRLESELETMKAARDQEANKASMFMLERNQLLKDISGEEWPPWRAVVVDVMSGNAHQVIVHDDEIDVICKVRFLNLAPFPVSIDALDMTWFVEIAGERVVQKPERGPIVSVKIPPHEARVIRINKGKEPARVSLHSWALDKPGGHARAPGVVTVYGHAVATSPTASFSEMDHLAT